MYYYIFFVKFGDFRNIRNICRFQEVFGLFQCLQNIIVVKERLGKINNFKLMKLY